MSKIQIHKNKSHLKSGCTSYGIITTARLGSPQKQLATKQTQICNGPSWKLCGDDNGGIITITTITAVAAKAAIAAATLIPQTFQSLSKPGRYLIQSMIYAITKQHKSITPSQIKDTVGILLESNKTVQARDNAACAALAEKHLLPVWRAIQ